MRPRRGLADSVLTDSQRSRCYDVLIAALADPSPWVRVHAAEALVALQRPGRALAAFRPQAHSSEPQYRIVVWRVLAAAEPQANQRRYYVEPIRQAFLDARGSTGRTRRRHWRSSMSRSRTRKSVDSSTRLLTAQDRRGRRRAAFFASDQGRSPRATTLARHRMRTRQRHL
jgi:hypothetical protein